MFRASAEWGCVFIFERPVELGLHPAFKAAHPALAVFAKFTGFGLEVNCHPVKPFLLSNWVTSQCVHIGFKCSENREWLEQMRTLEAQNVFEMYTFVTAGS